MKGFSYFIYITIFLITIVSFFVSNVPQKAYAQTQNLIQNSGFEDPISKAQSLKEDSTDIIVEQTNKESYEGTKSLYVKAKKGRRLQQSATITSSQHFFAHANALIKKGSIKLAVKDNSGKEISSSVRSASMIWQRLTVDLPAGSINDTLIYEIIAFEDAEFYVDNLILHQLDFTPLPKGEDHHDTKLYWKGKEIKNPTISESVLGTSTNEPTPYPAISKTYPMKILISAQVDPEFATSQNILQIINNKYASLGITRQFEGTVEIYDQAIPTNCTNYTYAAPTFVPDEYCTHYEHPEYILGAVYHGLYDGAASTSSFFAADDTTNTKLDRRYFVLLHELGHVMGIGDHYDDAWSGFNTVNKTYYDSAYLGDIMGYGYEPLRFLEHYKELVNRSPYLSGYGVNLTRNNLPNTIKLLDKNNQPFYGRLTVYSGNPIHAHQYTQFDEQRAIGPFSVYGSLDYREINKPLLAFIKAENTHGNTSTWLESSIIQVAFWQGKESTLTIPLESDPVVTPQPTPTAVPSKNGKILIRSEYEDLIPYSANPDGSGKIRLIKETGAGGYGASFSKDGKMVFYYTAPPLILHVLDNKGMNIKDIPLQIPSNSPNHPSYLNRLVSTDGKVIYFSIGDYSSTAEIFKVDTQTSQTTSVMNTNGYSQLMDISPKGDKLLILEKVENVDDIFEINIDGTNKKNITNTPNFAEDDVSYSFDSKYIVFIAWYDGSREIYKKSLSDLNTPPVRLTNTPDTFESSPYFSPDGTKIVFGFNRQTGNTAKGEIYTMNSDGTNSTIISDPKYNEILGFSAWAPDPAYSDSFKKADINHDGKVDIQDYNILVTQFNQTGANLSADFNNSGKVDIQDYNILVNDFGT